MEYNRRQLDKEELQFLRARGYEDGDEFDRHQQPGETPGNDASQPAQVGSERDYPTVITPERAQRVTVLIHDLNQEHMSTLATCIQTTDRL